MSPPASASRRLPAPQGSVKQTGNAGKERERERERDGERFEKCHINDCKHMRQHSSQHILLLYCERTGKKRREGQDFYLT